ncbi:hypothetical protein SAMN05421831_104111 [Allopseudospirillum japonicum]|uniref:Uncharacterized protein n=1 Tax=Allopseudospirillum japonicum TaxID=64971 RepID=A0A1H6RKI3_9GAMM|nr:DUF6489 family protein [Allopseudospirillum japonicum]SEI56321.1 hypothetical protein SAMN05421831_104111 [Allopseudospirillum japonicum]
MKLNVEVDMTPEEFRRAMGLPDVHLFQQELMQKIREQMEAGVDGYDPLSLFKPFITQGFDSLESYQKLMMQVLSNYSPMGTSNKRS